MQLISFLAFNLVRTLVKISFALFHKNEVIKNEKYFKLNGHPTILVSNHPNTMVDVFHVAKKVGSISFLANAGLFKNKYIGKILRILHGVPVERPQDVQGRMIDNKNVFKECDDFLADGGCLYIAPEGSSYVERRLRRIKSGTARIGLSAENNNNFSLGVQILPVGVTYSNYYGFRSDIFINVGDPILIKDYQNAYQTDNFKASKLLTSDLSRKMKNLILHTEKEDDDVDEMVISIEQILNYSPTTVENFQKSKDLIAKLITVKNTDETLFETLKKQIKGFFEELNSHKLNIKLLVDSKVSFGEILKTVLLFPIFLWGFINNIVPFLFPAIISKKIKIYHGYIATIKIVVGIFSFFVFYPLQINWIHNYFDNRWITLLYALLLIPTGLIAWDFAQNWRHTWRKILISVDKNKKSSVVLLDSKRKSLIQTINSVK